MLPELSTGQTAQIGAILQRLTWVIHMQREKSDMGAATRASCPPARTESHPKELRMEQKKPGRKTPTAAAQAAPPAAPAKTKTKLDMMEDLLKRKNGANVDELMKATGWQKHSVRGALSRLKSAGRVIEQHMNDKRGRVYQEKAGA